MNVIITYRVSQSYRPARESVTFGSPVVVVVVVSVAFASVTFNFFSFPAWKPLSASPASQVAKLARTMARREVAVRANPWTFLKTDPERGLFQRLPESVDKVSLPTCNLHVIHVMSTGLTCKELVGARFQLYRSQILQEDMRSKALAEIYTMHSFTLL